MQEVVLGVSARCKHNSINEITKRCAFCEWEELLLKKKLPFKVRFIGKNPLKENGVYEVVGIILEGNVEKGPVPGLLLEGEEGLIARQTYDPTMFSLRLEPPKGA